MERKDFIGLVKTAVADYIAADEAFDDDARLHKILCTLKAFEMHIERISDRGRHVLAKTH